METPGTLLRRLRESGPLIQCLTNYVAMDLSANALLALGASPAMVHAEEEAAEFASLAQGLLVNIGTLSPRWVSAMASASRVAVQRGIPVVLDPVAAGATNYRKDSAAKLLPHTSIVRGNGSEIMAVAGGVARSKGVDSGDDSSAARTLAEAFARSRSDGPTTDPLLVAITGEVDLLTDGTRTFRVFGGSSTMTRVTAMGCALSAAVAAGAAVAEDRFDGALAALAWWKWAGAEAARSAKGPASFRVAFIDALFTMTPTDADEVDIEPA
ncbi:MAG: hydroxyethylthiazole kinase [Myxococcota bacterium]